ncbi:MAG: cobalamin B12-binding domain-containing protein [Deltaproteobacteria bacterium]|nr:cobalamin B12-binding domain-containing protein [Deltaproteobacteria bacterium]
MSKSIPIRILIAKPGLDGHDRGVKVVSLALRDAGMEVIYTGLHRTVDEIVRAAIQENVDVIGLSMLSGSHLPITQRLMQRIEEEGITDVLVVVGGNIPKKDIEKMKSLGVDGIFPTDSSFEDIVSFIHNNARKKLGSLT